MRIACPKCGIPSRLEHGNQCPNCQAVLRRCTDCSNFSRSTFYCKSFHHHIALQEAEQPGLLSSSTSCRAYHGVRPMLTTALS